MKVDKIEEYILEKIKNEEYVKGEMINSENQLSQKFNVSRMTVRKAIENLIQRNYLYRKHGKGTYVKDNSNKISVFLNEMIGFNERAKRYNLKAETKIINYKLIKADKILSEKLKIEEKEKTNIYKSFYSIGFLLKLIAMYSLKNGPLQENYL